MCYQDEILKTILTLPNFGAKEYHGYLKDFPLDFNAEILETPSPFAVNFVDEKRLGTDHDYEDARLEFGKVLELFLKRSSESRQILGSYARFDFAAQALANVSAQN
jgi:hypothetical protein